MTDSWQDASWKAFEEIMEEGIPNFGSEEWEDRPVRFFLDGLQGILEELLFVYHSSEISSKKRQIDNQYKFWFSRLFNMAWVAAHDLYVENPDHETPLQVARKVLNLIARKQHDYGHGNIDTFGIDGVVIRVSDKVARLKNLFSTGREAANESAEDSFHDLMGYSIVALMLLNDTFKLELE